MPSDANSEEMGDEKEQKTKKEVIVFLTIAC